MTILNIISNENNNIVNFIAIITFLVTCLSQFLSIIEYFRLKGKWDYFLVDKMYRNDKYNKFNTEYIVTSLFILSLIFITMMSKDLRKNIDNYLCISITIILITIAIFLISYAIFYIFSKEDIDKKVYKRKEMLKFVLEKSLFTTIKYLILMIIFIVGYHCFIKKLYIEVLIIIIIFGLFEVSYEYCVSRMRAARNRFFNIIKYDNKKYCILEKVNQDYYAVSIKIDKNTITLFLDQKIIINSIGLKYTSEIYDNHKRIYNGEEIKEKKQILF